MNTTTNRRAMGDDDDATFNDDAMRETATTRWVRGHYDKTRRNATTTTRRWHLWGGEREKERGSPVLEKVGPNNQWGERGDGGKTTKATTGEGEMPCGQRSGGNSGRGKTMAAIAGGEVVSSWA